MKIITNKIDRKKLLIASTLLVLGATQFLSSAQAADTNANFTSSATLSDSCRFTSTIAVRFNSFVPQEISGEEVGRGIINLTCTRGTSFELSFGSGLAGTQTDRKMTALNMNGLNTDKLNYSMRYTEMDDSSLNGQLVGDGTSGTKTYRDTAIGDMANNYAVFNVYVSKSQFVKPDNYYDNITLTLSY